MDVEKQQTEKAEAGGYVDHRLCNLKPLIKCGLSCWEPSTDTHQPVLVAPWLRTLIVVALTVYSCARNHTMLEQGRVT